MVLADAQRALFGAECLAIIFKNSRLQSAIAIYMPVSLLLWSFIARHLVT
jgi:hypothetical protein